MPQPYKPNDKFAQRARVEGYRARSVYKLEEIDSRFQVIAPAMTVLDCGAAPGSWLQYTSKKVGPKGKIVGIDLQKIRPVSDNVILLQESLLNPDAIEKQLQSLSIKQFDLVLSDIAPDSTGIQYADQMRSIELNYAVLTLARKFLRKNGNLVMKVFMREKFDLLVKELKKYFGAVKTLQVRATRDSSNEAFVVCFRLK